MKDKPFFKFSFTKFQIYKNETMLKNNFKIILSLKRHHWKIHFIKMIIFSCHYKYAYSYSNVIIFKSLWINDMLFVASFKLTLFSPKYNQNILKLLPWLSNFQGRPLDNCLLGISTCTSYRHSNLKTSKTKLLFPPNILAFSTLILLTPFFQLYRPKTLVPSWTPLSQTTYAIREHTWSEFDHSSLHPPQFL